MPKSSDNFPSMQICWLDCIPNLTTLDRHNSISIEAKLLQAQLILNSLSNSDWWVHNITSVYLGRIGEERPCPRRGTMTTSNQTSSRPNSKRVWLVQMSQYMLQGSHQLLSQMSRRSASRWAKKDTRRHVLSIYICTFVIGPRNHLRCPVTLIA